MERNGTQTRSFTRGRKVLMDKLRGVRPPRPTDSEVIMHCKGDYSFTGPFPKPPPTVLAAEEEWERSEDAKGKLKIKFVEESELRQRVYNQFLDWLVREECEWEQTPQRRIRSSHQSELHSFSVYIIDSFAEYASNVNHAIQTQASSHSHLSPIERLLQPTHITDELFLALGCALYDRCSASLGSYSNLFITVRSVLLPRLYCSGESVLTGGWNSLAGRVRHYLSNIPYFATHVSTIQEHEALTEELHRAREHMQFWSWSIWRSVLAGSQRKAAFLTKIETWAQNKINNILLRKMLQRWKSYITSFKANSRCTNLHITLRPFSDAPSLEGCVSDVVVAYKSAKEEAADLEKQLISARQIIEKLVLKMSSSTKKAKMYEIKSLEAIKSSTEATSKLSFVEQELQESLSVQRSLRAEIEDLKSIQAERSFASWSTRTNK